MPKDEIKDFMTFCEDYLYLPNIEVDTVSDKYDFGNGDVKLNSNSGWGSTEDESDLDEMLHNFESLQSCMLLYQNFVDQVYSLFDL